MKNSVIRIVLACAVFAVFSGVSFAADVVLTPFGQSPDAMMVKVVLKKLGVEGRLEKILATEDLQDEKVLITVVAGSSKGLGEAGIDKDAEIARVKNVAAAAKGGDYDGLFSGLVEGTDLEMLPAKSVRETGEPLQQVLSEWGVL
jgi:hypothetical protein